MMSENPYQGDRLLFVDRSDVMGRSFVIYLDKHEIYFVAHENFKMVATADSYANLIKRLNEFVSRDRKTDEGFIVEAFLENWKLSIRVRKAMLTEDNRMFCGGEEIQGYMDSFYNGKFINTKIMEISINSDLGRAIKRFVVSDEKTTTSLINKINSISEKIKEMGVDKRKDAFALFAGIELTEELA